MISPEYASGAMLAEKTEAASVGIVSVGALATAALGFKLNKEVKKKAKSMNPKSASTRIIRHFGRTTTVLIFISLYAAVISLSYGSVPEYRVFLGDYEYLNTDLLAQDIIEFKGQKERERQLEGKTLAKIYHYINEKCDAEPTPDTPMATINDEDQERSPEVVDAYIKIGCPREFLLIDNIYDVNTLVHEGVITENNANIAIGQIQIAINKGQHRTVPIPL